MYSGEYDVCSVILSVHPHRASCKVCLTTGLEINLDVIPVIMTGGSLNLPVTAEFIPVIVTP